MKIYHPTTAAEALKLRLANPSSVYLAGGTDNLRLGSPAAGMDLIDLSGALSSTITEQNGMLEIGALCTLQDLKEHASVPAFLREAAGFCASMVKRESATVGGNLGTRRQDSYLAAALAAANAELRVLTPEGEKRKTVADFMNCSCKCLILSFLVSKNRTGSVKRFGNTVSSHATLIAAESEGLYALSVSGSPFICGNSPELASRITFRDDLTGSASYKKYLAEVVFEGR